MSSYLPRISLLLVTPSSFVDVREISRAEMLSWVSEERKERSRELDVKTAEVQPYNAD
jgi:hypothetical protein